MIDLRQLPDASLSVLEAILEEFCRVKQIGEDEEGIYDDDLLNQHLDSEEALFEFLKAHFRGDE